MGNDPANGIDPDGGYKTKWGQFWGWVGNGFKGKRFTSETGTGVYKYGIDVGEGEVNMVFSADDFTRNNLDSWDLSIYNNSARMQQLDGFYPSKSLRYKLDRGRLQDYRGVISEVMQEQIAPVYEVQREYGLWDKEYLECLIPHKEYLLY